MNNHSGLYFENKGSIRIINTKWTLLTYVNLTTYNEREKIFDTYTQEMGHYCVENELIPTQKNIICENFKTVFLTYTKEILSKRGSILKNLEHPTGRVRRGLINGIGNIANVLFRVCDNMCTEENINNIQQLTTSQTTSLNILKHQTRVVKSIVQQSEQSFRDNKFLRDQINTFISEMKKSVNFLKNETMELKHKISTQDAYLLLNLLLNQYAFETNIFRK